MSPQPRPAEMPTPSAITFASAPSAHALSRRCDTHTGAAEHILHILAAASSGRPKRWWWQIQRHLLPHIGPRVNICFPVVLVRSSVMTSQRSTGARPTAWPRRSAQMTAPQQRTLAGAHHRLVNRSDHARQALRAVKGTRRKRRSYRHNAADTASAPEPCPRQSHFRTPIFFLRHVQNRKTDRAKGDCALCEFALVPGRSRACYVHCTKWCVVTVCARQHKSFPDGSSVFAHHAKR